MLLYIKFSSHSFFPFSYNKIKDEKLSNDGRKLEITLPQTSRNKKSMKILIGYSEAVYRRTNNTMTKKTKGKRTNNDL